jgi:hypothetical protein
MLAGFWEFDRKMTHEKCSSVVEGLEKFDEFKGNIEINSSEKKVGYLRFVPPIHKK